MQNTEEIWRLVDAKQDAVHRAVGPRLGHAGALLQRIPLLRRTHRDAGAAGLPRDQDVAGIPTAVMGEAGEDGPVIAILGEYDALPGLSQEAGVAEPRPLPGTGYGHGCGHNLLGSASLLAATAVKDYLAANGIKGRVRYYGCPAEEGGAAKGFMVRAGAFADVDIAISWHPSAFCRRRSSRCRWPTRASISRFTGRASHAAGVAASGAQRAGRGGADECRRELHARAHAVRRARPLRAAGCRRHRAERGAGVCEGALPDPRPQPAGTEPADRARAQDRRRRRADDRDQR